MDSRIDKYLQTVESQLRDLSQEQREEEVREMRQHLEALASRLVEGGASEAAAIQSAIEQFGPPRQVGRSVRWASRHSQKRRRAWATLLAMACHGVGWLLIVGLVRVAGIEMEAWPTIDRLLGFETRQPLVVALGLLFLLPSFMAGIVARRTAKTPRVILDVLAAHYVLFALVLWLAPNSDAHQILPSTWMPLFFGVMAGAGPAPWVSRLLRLKSA